jgi:hypothetical protein
MALQQALTGVEDCCSELVQTEEVRGGLSVAQPLRAIGVKYAIAKQI